jgi:hypothetical protein
MGEVIRLRKEVKIFILEVLKIVKRKPKILKEMNVNDEYFQGIVKEFEAEPALHVRKSDLESHS